MTLLDTSKITNECEGQTCPSGCLDAIDHISRECVLPMRGASRHAEAHGQPSIDIMKHGTQMMKYNEREENNMLWKRYEIVRAKSGSGESMIHQLYLLSVENIV
jgi:hypothetical protein